MTAAATEREVYAALKAGLAATAEVRWGWIALQSAELPPIGALVTLQRTLASATGYMDQCDDTAPLVDTTLAVHSWASEYEPARALNAQARALVLATGGWALQSEADEYDGTLHAWRISGEYLGAGMAAE